MPQPERKRLRLPDHDYSSPGAYFVTICTKDRRCILSRITVGEGLAPPAVELTGVGIIVEEQIRALPERYPSIAVDKYVIMPNHVHLLLCLKEGAGGASPSPTLFDVLRVFKSMSTRRARGLLGPLPLWQRSYYEHVIRSEGDAQEIQAYIDRNPAAWAEDQYYA